MDRIYEKSLILWFPWTCCVGPNTDLPSNTNISKTVRVNTVSTIMFFQEYSVSFLMICKLIAFAPVFLWLLMFNVCQFIRISKIDFFNFSSTGKVKQDIIPRFFPRSETDGMVFYIISEVKNNLKHIIYSWQDLEVFQGKGLNLNIRARA